MTQLILSLQSVVVAGDEQTSSEIGEEVVILSLANGKYYGLDPVGAFIWGCLQQPIAVIDVCGLLLSEYDVAREQAEQDVLALVQHLADEGLIEVQHAEATEVSTAPLA